MYGREDLKECEISRRWWYRANEADKVMDAMEQRIKELESIPHTDNTAVIEALQRDKDDLIALNEKRIARIKELEEENKHLEDYIDAYQKSEALNIEKLDKKDERIKELEQALAMASDPALHPTCADCDKCQPKWISVNDRLPEGNPSLPALTKNGNKTLWGAWHDGNLEIYGIAYWLDNALPPPPTTEEKRK